MQCVLYAVGIFYFHFRYHEIVNFYDNSTVLSHKAHEII